MNISFIRKYNPIKATLYGLLFWSFLFLFFPLNVKYKLNFFPVLLIILNYAFFLLGVKSLSTVNVEEKALYKIDTRVLKKIMYVIIVIAFTGFLLKMFDKFYLRDTSFSNTMSENRVLLSKSGPSIISIISAITNPFSFLPLFIYYFLKQKGKLLFLVCFFLFFSASFEFIVLGSRSGLFILLILFSLYLVYFKKIKITLGKFIILSVALFFLGIYSINLFISRTTDFTKSDAKSVTHILTKANYNFTIEPTEGTKKVILSSESKTYQSAHLGLINFVQYYLHGIYEFGYMYDNHENSYNYGAYTFNVFAKFINIIFRTNIDLEKIQKSPPRTGIYTTFFGPIFMDFGWFSLVFMFFFGVFQKHTYNKVLNGRFQYTPLLFYFLIIDFFLLVINFISGAQGLYTIVSFILFAIIYSLLSGKIVISHKNNKKQYVKILK
jgi:hypothetical protein